MKVDSNIAKAINEYIAKNKIPAYELAKKLKVTAPTIIKWRTVGNNITPPNWDMLFPFIRPYLPDNRIYINDVGREEYSSPLDEVPDKKYIPQMIPIITMDEAAKYDRLVESFDQYAKSKSKERAEFHAKSELPKGMFAVRINNGDWFPSIPKGALLFVAGDEFPSNGDMIMVKTTTQVTYLAYYKVSGSSITITPIANSIDLKNELKFSKDEARQNIEWICPIVSYEVRLK